MNTEPKQKEFYHYMGKQTVTIGDVFTWNGIYPGVYKVVGWGDKSGVYSPSGLGGTSTVMVENEKVEIIEWCGDSVAAGVYETNLK